MDELFATGAYRAAARRTGVSPDTLRRWTSAARSDEFEEIAAAMRAMATAAAWRAVWRGVRKADRVIYACAEPEAPTPKEAETFAGIAERLIRTLKNLNEIETRLNGPAALTDEHKADLGELLRAVRNNGHDTRAQAEERDAFIRRDAFPGDALPARPGVLHP